MMTQVNFSQNPLAILSLFIFGVFSWTLLEYVLHKYLFHGEDYWMKRMPHNKYLFTAHFFTHGIHHAFPQDRYRIVFPPVPGNLFIMYPVVYRGFKALIPAEYFYNFFLGLTVGYLIYEMIHFSLHHISPKSEYMRNLKLYHMQHHYKFGTVGFGVSSKFWDVVFKTEIDMNNKSRKTN
jgi:4-hydroxysphinganine ceramide fatty acyl 2-hydroxylase